MMDGSLAMRVRLIPLIESIYWAFLPKKAQKVLSISETRQTLNYTPARRMKLVMELFQQLK